MTKLLCIQLSIITLFKTPEDIEYILLKTTSAAHYIYNLSILEYSKSSIIYLLL